MALTPAVIEKLLVPYLPAKLEDQDRGDKLDAEFPPTLFDQLSRLLALLLRWNERTNLTAVRGPEEIVTRHFGESLFAARCLPPCRTMLDLGSGAGFPGLPIQLFHPALEVTLGESQGKKVAFLREAIRVLGLKAEVYGHRVQSMQPDRRFDAVTLRAVDDMSAALLEASLRSRRHVLVLTSQAERSKVLAALPEYGTQTIAVPGTSTGCLVVASRWE